jgi:hypothetical protein
MTYAIRNHNGRLLGYHPTKRAAEQGPVFITDRGRPAYALLRIEDYYKLQGQPTESLLDVMNAIPGGDGMEFEPPTLQLTINPAPVLQAD